MGVGRRAAADHGHQLRRAPSSAPTFACSPSTSSAGLGFATGFDHDRLPPALLAEAEAVGFPLFEVPYEMPFIAITEKAFTRLVNEQYDVLERGTALHERLERLVIEKRGLVEILGSVAGAVDGAAIVLDAGGRVIARSRHGAPATAPRRRRSPSRLPSTPPSTGAAR